MTVSRSRLDKILADINAPILKEDDDLMSLDDTTDGESTSDEFDTSTTDGPQRDDFPIDENEIMEHYEDVQIRAEGLLSSLNLSEDKAKVTEELSNYLCSLSTTRHFGLEDPQAPILLVTGGPGVGKSYVVDAIKQLAKEINAGYIQTTAFTGIAAVNIKGETINTTFNIRVGEGGKKKVSIQNNKETVDELSHTQLQQFKADIDIRNLALLVIDEISTVTPKLLAIINARLQQAKYNEKPFGGVGIMFVGDFMTLPPPKELSLLASAVAMADLDCRHIRRTRFGVNRERYHIEGRKKQSRLWGKLQIGSLVRVGTDLFSKAKHIELMTQNRCANDPIHEAFLRKMGKGGQITMDDLSYYRELTPEDVEEDPEWKFAPILVSTNRERLDFTFAQAQEFAKVHGVPVVRWACHYKNWKGKPRDAERQVQAKEDTCFWQYFVKGADAYLSHSINTKKNLQMELK